MSLSFVSPLIKQGQLLAKLQNEMSSRAKMPSSSYKKKRNFQSLQVNNSVPVWHLRPSIRQTVPSYFTKLFPAQPQITSLCSSEVGLSSPTQAVLVLALGHYLSHFLLSNMSCSQYYTSFKAQVNILLCQDLTSYISQCFSTL